ncbi:MAG: hypothetical protein SFW08_10240 [Gemmatimonadaceae bacterium]|nr:hypothetical protein [Gemmatimonadaceae bacterium]
MARDAARTRVAAARRELRAARTVRALAAAGLAFAAIEAIAWGLAALLDIDALHRMPAGFVAAGLGALLAGWTVQRRATAAKSDTSTALWLESQLPELRFALVTRLELEDGHAAVPALEARVATVPVESRMRAVIWPPLLRLSAMAAVALMAVLAIPRLSDGRSSATPLPARRVANALADWQVSITPPAYTRRAAERYDNPVRVVAPTGAGVRVSGVLGVAPVAMSIGAAPVPVDSSGADNRWAVELPMPRAAVALNATSGAAQRVLLLEPIADSLPTATLQAPARDSVFRMPTGTLALRAVARDDYGVRDAWFEVIISSGEGESFRFRTLTLGRRAGAGAGPTELRAALTLDGLGLSAGDLIHLRAVARDGNTVTGPGVGGSDTRTLRIARPDEYDSVAVEGAPPPDPKKGILSQRMLIQLTEALVANARRLSHAQLTDESRRIAKDQDALRRQVGDVVFSRLDDNGQGAEHAHDHSAMTPEQLMAEAQAEMRNAGAAVDFAEGESPVIAINRPLLEAYNAMWDASRALSVGEPKAALPPMYVALAAIQRARAAERIYLRGRPKDIVVDLAKVRLAGKTDGIGPGPRRPRPSESDATRRLLGRFNDALALLPRDAAGAVNQLLLLRAELLGSAPTLAAPLADAIDALQRGGDVTGPLAAAYRRLAGEPAQIRPASGWSVDP